MQTPNPNLRYIKCRNSSKFYIVIVYPDSLPHGNPFFWSNETTWLTQLSPHRRAALGVSPPAPKRRRPSSGHPHLDFGGWDFMDLKRGDQAIEMTEIGGE